MIDLGVLSEAETAREATDLNHAGLRKLQTRCKALGAELQVRDYDISGFTLPLGLEFELDGDADFSFAAGRFIADHLFANAGLGFSSIASSDAVSSI